MSVLARCSLVINRVVNRISRSRSVARGAKRVEGDLEIEGAVKNHFLFSNCSKYRSNEARIEYKFN